MAVQFVYNYFFERHIPVNDNWLCEAIVYIQSQRDSLDNDALAAAVHEQWLFSNIKLSTEPTLSLPSSTDTPKKFIFSDNIVLQINSVVDIGASLLSQYTQLTYDFEDNSGFIVSDDNEKDTDTASTIIKPRRMLLMELTDGQTMVKAIEYRPIRQLSLLTCPGCKILLFGSIICRRNILLLTESSCVVLGGEDETLMKTNRPVEVMARALGKQVRSKIPRDKQSTAACGRGVSSAHRSDRTDKSYAVEVNAIQYNSSSEAQIAGELERRRVPSDWLQSSPVTTPLTGRKVSHPTVSKPAVPSGGRPVMEVRPLADRDSSSNELTPRARPSSASVSNTTSRFIRNCAANIAVSRRKPRKATIESKSPIEPKRIKVESFDDDEITVIGIQQSQSHFSPAQPSMTKDSPIVSPQNLLSPQQKSAGESLLMLYGSAETVFIADALSATRFALGSIRKNIVAVMREVKVPLRIVDDIWTMNVVLADESCKKLECIVAHSVLVDLIGLNPEEAVAIRASKDKARRREGTLRLKSVQESMERLDVVWEVEFYACARSTPVVRKMQTLAQKLGLIR